MHRLARRAALPLGAAAVLPTSRPRAEERAPAVQRRLTAVADLAIEAQLFQPAVPWPQWDCNWDHRELDSRGRRRSLLKPSGAPRRHLILIRHGQYDESASDDSGRVLTALGKRQAVQAGKRVAELLSQPGAVYRGVHSSRLARAVETADLIHAQLNNVPRLPGDPQLNEGVPCHAIPDGVHHAAAVYRDGARIEAAFRKYFKRALPWDEIDDDDGDEDHPVAYPPVDAPTDEYDVLVCHANVIRFFALRALQLPPEGWLRLCTMNCSVTHVTISPDGKVSLRSLGDTGHLSVDEVTFGTYTGTNW